MGDTGRRLVLAVAALWAAAGCASRQDIPIDCVPAQVTIFVDGRQLEENPESLSLRTDQPHTVFLKGGDHAPQMVVLESVEEEGRTRLEPADLCREVSFREMAPELELEIEEEEGAAATP